MKKLLLAILAAFALLATSCDCFFLPGEGYIYSESGAVIVGGDNKPIRLINNENAANPTFEQLLIFISEDDTNTLPYVKDGPEVFVCSDFAETLHNNAEQAGIKAGWVSIDYADGSIGHAINAFETTDMGLVFIDCTGGLLKTWDGEQYIYESAIDPYPAADKWDTIGYLAIGKIYGHIGIDEAESLEYSFLEDYLNGWESYKTLLAEYNHQVKQYNEAVEGKTFITGTEEYQQMKAWQTELKEMEKTLSEMEDELGDYYYLPSGIVSSYSIYW
ncbi:MAG: hypothetical protein GX226_05645 [Dehalococcoidales bacterium]|jgi:hypothetical protein|nr:hypothetical protein [Dehalococcoidales bacterium]